MRMMKTSLFILSMIGVFWYESLLYSAVPKASEIPSQPDISKELSQTLSSLFSITIQNYLIASRWNFAGSANLVEFQSLIPFKVWEQKNILRLNVPFRTQSELGPGLSDVRIFDLLVFGTDNGFWGVGPAFNLGVNKGPGIDTVQVGPAAGFVFSSIKNLSIGLLNQNFFSDQVALSTLQPILVYRPGNIWTIGLGEFPLVYNWNTNQFAVFSVGFQLGVLIPVAEQPVRFFVNPQFNTKSNTQLYHWTVAFGVNLPISSPALQHEKSI
jgi:hypothetical protein